MRRLIDPRSIAIASALGAGVGALPLTAEAAAPHEVYASGGGTLFSTPRRLMAGIGFGVGYRLHFGAYFSVFAEVQVAGYLGYFGEATVGTLFEPRGAVERGWAPALGIGASAVFGESLTVLTAANPERVSPVAFAVQLRLAPIRWRSGAWTAAALIVDGGVALEPGAVGYVLGLQLLEVGYRF